MAAKLGGRSIGYHCVEGLIDALERPRGFQTLDLYPVTSVYFVPRKGRDITWLLAHNCGR
ncbi:hypothetical protein BDV29DRAFT_172827 [Aspergillus leporis]|uniref:Uncharacterized protein n=1 Tax=Aspergillus leporis TaxID=41062 RepID=A0A5N5X2B4_9EURO|nr:hypothetical protein BDV29DRAFT_172827 [Aspergillus leporis]